MHHRVELTQGSDEKTFILCASLADEGWILNLLYQMLNFTIGRWDKSIETPFSFTTRTVFVIVSPNLRKCKSLEEYAYNIRRTNQVQIHSLKIANVEGPTFTRLVASSIDATSLSQEELAHRIFVATLSKSTVINTVKFYCNQYFITSHIPFLHNIVFCKALNT